jgi:anti-anti-sigma factor
VFVDLEGADPDFAVTAAVSDERVLVTVTGEVDMSTADGMFRAAVKDGAGTVLLDLRGVTFFDSAAIHALLQLAEHYGAGLRVLASPPVRRVLEISGLATQPWLTDG